MTEHDHKDEPIRVLAPQGEAGGSSRAAMIVAVASVAVVIVLVCILLFLLA